MRLHCAVTHFDEPTLDLCIDWVRKQSLPASEISVISGESPASNAFNRALQSAYDHRADLLIHLAADVILERSAFKKLLDVLRPEKHYAVMGQGFDIFNGPGSPVGLWAINVKALEEKFWFRDVFKMDLDFCDRIEAGTGRARTKSGKGQILAYHHPIWTPEELFRKFRYNAGKYHGKVIARYLAFLDDALKVNPSNKTLRCGLIGLKRGISEPIVDRAPNRELFAAEWADVSDLLEIDGGEYFAYHEDFVEIGRQLLGSSERIVPMAGPFFVRGGGSINQDVKKTLALANARSRTKDRLISLVRPLYRRSPAFVKHVVRRMRETPTAANSGKSSLPIRLDPMHTYGSRTEGVVGWDEKWKRTRQDRRVLMIAPKDFAGSMYKWAEAVNRCSPYAARLMTFTEHQYGYPQDLVVPECSEKRLNAVRQLADEAGLLHLKDEHSWYLSLPETPNLRLLNELFFSMSFTSKPKIFTHYGGYARKLKSVSDYIERVGLFDLRIAMTPDLNYEWFSGKYIPHTIDVENIDFCWKDNNIFGHSPSSPEKKATYLLEEAMLVLEAKWPKIFEEWSFDLIQGVSFEECMRRKRKASVFFDQAGRHRVANLGIQDVIGWYGNSAVEAMAFGIPTMAHLSDHAFDGADRAGVNIRDNPVINIEPTRNSLLAAFLQITGQTHEERRQLAERTRRYAEEFHGYEAVAESLTAAYDELRSSTRSGNKELCLARP